MAAIILPHRWRTQPQGPSELNLAHPLARGLRFWWSPVAVRNLWPGFPAAPNTFAVPRPGATPRGASRFFDGSADYVSYSQAALDLSSLVGSMFVLARSSVVDSTERTALSLSTSGDNNPLFRIRQTAGNVWGFQIRTDATDINDATGTTTVTSSRVFSVVVSVSGSGASNTLKLYVDGREEASQAAPIGVLTSPNRTTLGVLERGSLGQYFGGDILEAGMWGRVLTAHEAMALYENPWQMLRPLRRRIYFPSAAAGQTITVNQAIETELAQSITRLKAKALGQPTETDLAQAITGRKTLAIGQATETDLAQAITHAKAKLLGQATETDTAQAVASAKAKALGLVTETDLAQAITVSGNKIIAVGQVTETDTAQALTARKAKAFGQVTETDVAQAVAHAKTKALGQATETDLAQAIAPSIPNQVGSTSETDLAQPLSVRKAKTIGQIAEADVAQAVTSAKTRGLGLALEIDLGQPITWAPKRRILGQATETDLAQAIVASLSSTQLPLGKRFTVGPRAGFIVGGRNNFRVDQ